MSKVLAPKVSTALRDSVLAEVRALLSPTDLVLDVASGSIAVLREVDGEQIGVKITVQIPKGERGGDGWDAEAEAALFAEDQAEKQAKAAERAEVKAKKIAKDKAKREAEQA